MIGRKLRIGLVTSLRIIFVFAFSLALPYSVYAGGHLDSFYEQMEYLNARDQTIAQNILNADTPGFKAKDLSKGSKSEGIRLHTTNTGHISMDGASEKFAVFESDFDEIKPNGNNVSTQNELFKKGENASQLAETLSAYSKAKATLNTAILGAGK